MIVSRLNSLKNGGFCGKTVSNRFNNAPLTCISGFLYAALVRFLQIAQTGSGHVTVLKIYLYGRMADES